MIIVLLANLCYLCYFLSDNKQVIGKEELYFNIGSNEILHCSIRNKTSFAKWVINGQKVQGMNSSSKRVKTTEDGKLVIENVQLSDGGTYECLRLEYVQYYTVYINGRKILFNTFRRP